MKIAIDCRMIGSGGIGSYITALLPFFTENHQCILFGNPENLEKFKNNKTEIVECSVKTFSLKELFAFPKFFSRKINECDIYYTPYCNIPSGIKIPVYSTIHDVVFLDVPGLASKTGCIIRKLFYQYAVLRSKLIFTVSEFSKQRIISNLHCKKNIVVTYNAVPDWFYSSQSQNIQIEKENSILFVGNIKKHKGLSVLVDAFIAAKKQGFSAQLKIVGNSENFRTADESIFQKIQTAPENSIVFTGRISDEELKILYRTTKCLIQPSFYEGFGMPPMEAMSLGTNAIISDIPVFKEIYEKFPVIYFKTGDSEDLCKKLISIDSEKLQNVFFPEIYSFEKTFNIINENIKNF